ncbi:MAG: hypothetical protein AMK71_11250 [Nitrospira bacterium SG8_35_4]|nr:MAG: hypothetical protein AMK71_11250 [Nitrospira bacterium SG8_35_4]
MAKENITSSVFRKNRNVVFRQIGDESLLIPVANEVGDLSNIYNLNETGSKIWEYIDGERDVMEICRLITDEYDAPADVVMNDTVEFINDLDGITFLQEGYDTGD